MHFRSTLVSRTLLSRTLLSRTLVSPWQLVLPTGIFLLAAACSSTSNGAGMNSTGGQSTATGGSAGQGVATGGTSTGQAGGTSSGGTTVGAGGTVASGGTASGGMAGTAGTGTGGQGGIAAVGGAGGTAAGGTTGTGGASGGSTGATPPWRDLMVDPNTHSDGAVTFTATELDPMAGTSTTDTHAGSQESGSVNLNAPMIRGKLVMTLGGIGTCCGQGGIGGFAMGLGFHHMAIAYQTQDSSAPDQYKSVPEAMRTDEENRQMGDARMEAFDGIDRVDWMDINPHDAFEMRTLLGLKHMQEQDPGGDWAYFMNAEGTAVRWSDVYLVGYSYGSQTLAVWAKYVQFGRGIATSGPVDEGFPNATWIHAPSATPLENMIALIGSQNLDTKVQTTQAAGWLGDAINVASGATTADLMMGHIFVLEGQGHSEFCAGDGGNWKALCQYAFGVMQ